MKITFFFIISLFTSSLYSMGACWDGSYEQGAINRCCKVTAPLCMLIACCAQVKHVSDSHPVFGEYSKKWIACNIDGEPLMHAGKEGGVVAACLCGIGYWMTKSNTKQTHSCCVDGCSTLIENVERVVGDISDSFRGVQNIFYAKKRGEKDEKFKV